MSNYDQYSKASIIEFAQKLIGQTLNQACSKEIQKADFKGKGGFGQTLEKYYFGYEPNTNPEPDFKHVGMELKASPLKTLKNGRIQAKERIVLNIINYLKVHLETFETSSFWEKNAHLLLVFYHHSSDSIFLDYLIHLVDEWEYPADDLEIIRQDWLVINRKIQSGKAHELSEGDTFYLGACTKGSTAAGSLRDQPFNSCQAKQRAYSLKQGYVNHIIASIAGGKQANYGKLIEGPSSLSGNKSIEELVLSKFKPFFDKDVDEIFKALGRPHPKVKAKSLYASLTKAILGFERTQKIEEFEKADIQIKTIRLDENNRPLEEISFPAFKYLEIVKTEWEESDFKNILESKFLFIFFQSKNGKQVLTKAKFWNMPHSDILEAKEVWDKTVSLISEGRILEVKPVLGKRRKTHFPKMTEHRVSHVRPHANDSYDTYELPVSERISGENSYTKHSFWLNRSYVRDEIFLK